MSHPKVSVLIPAYNSEKYIGEAIQSILHQTFTDFELLVLDDGSTDNTWLEIQKFEDNRIQLLKNETNQGIPFSRNKLMDNAKGEYLAWLDADDMTMPERLAIQIKFMDENPDVGICGSWIQYFGYFEHIAKNPISAKEIKCRSLFASCIAQTSSLIRMKILKNHNLNYHLQFDVSQDYLMEVQIGELSLQSNIPQPLTHQRNHPKRISFVQNKSQIVNANKVRKYQLQKLKIEPSEKELSLHHQLVNKIESPITMDILQSIDSWLSKIKIANDTMKIFPEPEFTDMLKAIWLKNMAGYSRLGIGFWRLFSTSHLSPYQEYNLWMNLKFYVKCMLFR